MIHSLDRGRRGGGMVLLARKEFASEVTSFSFTGLDGDAADQYFVLARFATSATGDFYIRLNTSTDSYDLRGFRYNGGGTASYAGSQNAWKINGDPVVYPGPLIGKYNIFTQRLVGGGSMARGILGEFHAQISGQKESGMLGGSWFDDANKITSIDFFSSVTNGIGSASSILLYKM